MQNRNDAYHLACFSEPVEVMHPSTASAPYGQPCEPPPVVHKPESAASPAVGGTVVSSSYF